MPADGPSAIAQSTEGDRVSLPADPCLAVVRERYPAALTDPERGVWLFYPFRDGIQCFGDVAEYDDGDTHVSLTAVCQKAAFPVSGEEVVRQLELPPQMAYASDGSLFIHYEPYAPRAEVTPAWFADRFTEWDEIVREVVDHADKLKA
jgi:hypothetical protein